MLDDAFDALSTAEQRAVAYASLLPPDQAPREWLEWLLTQNADILPTTELDDETPPQSIVLMRLERLDVLSFKDSDKRILSLHRLWRSRANERRQDNGHDPGELWDNIELCLQSRHGHIIGEGGVADPDVIANRDHRWELQPLTETTQALWEQNRLQSAASISAWVSAANLHIGFINEALALLYPIETNEASTKGAVSLDALGACYCNMSVALQRIGNYSEALTYAIKSLEYEELYRHANDPIIGQRHSGIATIKIDLKEYESAHEHMRSAIQILRDNFGYDHHRLATAYSNLAIILCHLTDYREARKWIKLAIAIEERNKQTSKIGLGTLLANLAFIEMKRGNQSLACENWRHSLEIYRDYFDDEHPDIQGILQSMSNARCN